MNGCFLPGPRGRWRQNQRKDRPCGLPALLSPWSTVELATSGFRWLRTGPPTECGSSPDHGTANRRVRAKRLHSDEVHSLRNRVS